VTNADVSWVGEPTDAALLEASVGDASAFGVFYRRYSRRVLAYLVVRTRNPEVAADLTAETFAVALEALGSFDAGRSRCGSAAGWIFTIAHNTLMRSMRRGRVAEEARQRLGMSAPLVLEDDELERIEALGSGQPLVELLLELPREQRHAIQARVLEERAYEDIAAELRCSSLVVRKRVSRGLAVLRARAKEAS
jgi:RNA polymerase sigma factor (sigma-70 family)